MTRYRRYESNAEVYRKSTVRAMRSPINESDQAATAHKQEKRFVQPIPREE